MMIMMIIQFQNIIQQNSFQDKKIIVTAISISA